MTAAEFSSPITTFKVYFTLTSYFTETLKNGPNISYFRIRYALLVSWISFRYVVSGSLVCESRSGFGPGCVLLLGLLFYLSFVSRLL